MTISAIETLYAGCRFRSRLEARWAVLFDRLHIKWLYEEQGYVLKDGSTYLPDFHLPDIRVHVEVKGSDEALRESLPRLRAFVQEAKTTVVVLGEVPAVQRHAPMHPSIGLVGGKLEELACLLSLDRRSRWTFVQMLAEMPVTTQPAFCLGLFAEDEAANAYFAARSARFEHGETPVPGQRKDGPK